MSITTTLVSGQNAYVGAVSSRDTFTVSVNSGVQGPVGNTGNTGAQGPTGNTGVGVVSADFVDNHLVLTLSNTATIDAGAMPVTNTGNYTFSNNILSTTTSNGGLTINSGGLYLSANIADDYTGAQFFPEGDAQIYAVANIDFITGARGAGFIWSLDTNGKLNLPGGSTLAPTGNSIDLFAGTNGYAGLSSNNLTNFVWVDDNGSYIATAAGTWTFANTGTILFPDTTTQTTAWTGVAAQYTWTNVHTFSNTVNFNGNINVNGNTNYFTSNNIVYTDALIEVHAPGGNTSNVWSTNDGSDIGLRFHYYDSADKNAGLFMDNGTWRLKWVVNGTESAGQFSHTSNLGDIEANTVYANLIGTANNANNLGGIAAASYLVTNTAINIGNTVITGTLSATGNVTGNTAGFAIGYRDIPQLTSNTSTTIANTDMGKHYYCANTTSMTLTIANNATVAGIPIGAAISVVSYSTGNVVVTRGTGVSMYLAANSTSADRTVGAYGMATVMKVATDTWVISGAGVT